MSERYDEDFAVDEAIAGRSVTLAESAIIDFALQYDPQPFHLGLPGGEARRHGGGVARKAADSGASTGGDSSC